MPTTAQVTVTESFTGTTASGWVFGGSPGSTAPYLTANAGDAPGDGWLRLTESLNNQATFALFDSAVFAVNAQVQIEIEYTFWNGTDIGGAQNGRAGDGMTFFLVDGNVTSETFSPGAYGGSLGYAQSLNGHHTYDPGAGSTAGMTGGYLGFGFDNWGNYAAANEGKVGGYAIPNNEANNWGWADGDTHGFPNRIAVRGPESSDYEFIAASAPLNTLPGGGQMDFPTSTTRPDQTGADYRAFRLTLDANNQLTVEMKFGVSGDYITAFTADLSAYDRPDTFKIGFTASTGGATEVHEVRNVSVVMTPWQPDAFEWDHGAGTTNALTAANWVGDALPSINADILFGNAPLSGPQTVTLDAAAQLNSITFDSGYNYTLNGTGSLTLGDTMATGLPSINVNDYNNSQGQHKINLPLTLAEELRINNYSFSTLCLNGVITTGGNDIKVNGTGATNFNADIRGSGDVIKNGTGILTINSNNSDGTPWTGDLIINQGMVVATINGALGTTGGTTTVNNGGVLAFRDVTGSGLTYSTAESVTLNGRGILRGGEGETGALYNDGGNNSFAGNITLASASAVGSRDGVLTLSGVISGANSLTKLGNGVVSLTGSNTYTGATIIEGGVLRATTAGLTGGYATGGASGGNLQLAGGVLELASNTTFNRRLGTAADQVQWTGDGGFSAFGANRTVQLTNSGGTANGALTWNAGSFVPTGNALLLSSDYSNATVTLTNAIALGNAVREIRVANGSAVVDGILSGVLSGTGGIDKTGEGTLSLTANNTYTGATRVSGGALRVDNTNRIDGSNLQLNGGVLELAGFNMTRTLGTAVDQVQWQSHGGFAAFGANRTVTLSGGAALTWGSTANFVGANNHLIFGSVSANNNVTFTNNLALGSSGSRTVRVVQGTSTSVASGTLTGVVSGSAGLAVVGNGRLDLTGNNTHTGAVTVRGAEVRISGASGDLAQSSGFTVTAGGRLVIDNTSNTNNRIGDSANIALSGGTISLIGRSNGTSHTETVGQIQLTGGANTINAQRTGTNATVLASSALTRSGGATANFTNTGGTLGTTGNNPRITFTSAPTLTSNVLGYATVNGTALAGYGANGVVAVAGTNTAQGSWTASINATPTSDQTMTANRTVGSLSLGSGIDVNAGGFALTVNSGGLLATGATKSIISNGTIRTGTGVSDLIAHVYGAGGLDISAVIADNSGAKNFIKTGDGVLTLLGTTANTFTGTTYVNDGTLVLAKSDGVNAIAGNLIVGDGSGNDILRLNANEQIANSANLTLRGSEYGTGETILQFNGASGVGLTETLGVLTIDGHAVIDFAGGDVCNPNFLFLDDLLMATTDSRLFIRNWVDFTDFLLVRNTANLTTVLSQITFEGYGDMAYWQDYDTQYSRITPVPEPSTYGAMLMGAVLAFFGYRRWKQRKPVPAAKQV